MRVDTTRVDNTRVDTMRVDTIDLHVIFAQEIKLCTVLVGIFLMCAFTFKLTSDVSKTISRLNVIASSEIRSHILLYSHI